MKKTDLLPIISLLLSGGLTYLLVTETNGSRLKKENPTIYNNLQEKPEELKAKITEQEAELANFKTALSQKTLVVEAMGEGETKEEAKKELETQAAELSKKQEIVSLYKSVDAYGLKMPIITTTNIGKSVGVGAILFVAIWFIFNVIIKAIKPREN